MQAPSSIWCLIILELLISFSVIVNEKLSIQFLTTLFRVPRHTVCIVGFINAVLLSSCFKTNWVLYFGTALVIQMAFTAFSTVWGHTFLLFGALISSMIATGLEPLRWTFLANSIPGNFPGAHCASILAAWNFNSVVFWAIYESYKNSTTISYLLIVIAILTPTYFLLVVILQVTTITSPGLQFSWWKWDINVRKLCVSMEKNGKSWRRLFGFALPLTLHAVGKTLKESIEKYQLRCLVVHKHRKIPKIFLSLLIACPNIAALVLTVGLILITSPVAKRKCVNVTELQLIQVGMICGCFSLVITSIIQERIEDIEVPNEHEGLVFIFNMLPTSSHLDPTPFKLRDWVKIERYSYSAYRVPFSDKYKEFDMAVLNAPSDSWELIIIRADEDDWISYIIAEKMVFTVSGLGATEVFKADEAKLVIGCAIKNCSAHVHFKQKNTLQLAVDVSSTEKFTVCHIPHGVYNISLDASSTLDSINNFWFKPDELYAGIIHLRDDLFYLRIFDIMPIPQLSLTVYLLQQVLIGARDVLVEFGLFLFLRSETKNDVENRYFTYSLFFFIYKGIPLAAFAVLHTYHPIFLKTSVFVPSACLVLTTMSTGVLMLMSRSYGGKRQ